MIPSLSALSQQLWGDFSFPQSNIHHKMTSREPQKCIPAQGCVQRGSAPPQHVDRENNVTAVSI